MRKRLVYRADDLGYTPVYDEGFFKAIEDGIVTSADIMMDFPDSVPALERLRDDYPWVSIGWHSGHLWGYPVAGADKLPNLVNEEGRFKWRKDKKLQDEVSFEDAYTEYKAEMELYISVMGKAPDTTSTFMNRPIDQARAKVCDEYGVPYDFCGQGSGDRRKPVKPEYEHLKYEQPESVHLKGGFDLSYFYEYYNLMDVLTALEWTDEEEIWRIGGHPGFLDDFILKESTCNIHRVKDVIDVTSDEVKDFIAENHIELVNQRDVLYGTHEYQDHLRDIGSPMWAGNWE